MTPTAPPSTQTPAAPAPQTQPRRPSLLPTAPTVPIFDIRKAKILIYGAPGLGKTTLAAQFPGALFLATEPGLNYQVVAAINIDSWDKMLAVVAELTTTQHPFQTVVIDTIGNAHELVRDWVCRRLKINHPDDDKTKSYGLITNELKRLITVLAQSSMGLVMIAHESTVEVKTPTGEFTQIAPNLSDKPRNAIAAMCDFIFRLENRAVTVEGKLTYQRCLVTKPAPQVVAKDRTGKLPIFMPLSYAAIVKHHDAAVAAMVGAPALPPPTQTPPTPSQTTVGAPSPNLATAPSDPPSESQAVGVEGASDADA